VDLGGRRFRVLPVLDAGLRRAGDAHLAEVTALSASRGQSELISVLARLAFAIPCLDAEVSQPVA
jgi:hypothetical protein